MSDDIRGRAVSFTCTPCLGARHRKCEGACACSVCARGTSWSLRPRVQPKVSRARTTGPRHKRSGYHFTRHDSLTPAQVQYAAELRAAGSTWREVGEVIGKDFSGIRRRVIRECGGDPAVRGAA